MLDMVDSEIIERIERIEDEVEIMKKSLKKNVIKMGGRLAGVQFNQKDFDKAKKSLFEHA